MHPATSPTFFSRSAFALTLGMLVFSSAAKQHPEHGSGDIGEGTGPRPSWRPRKRSFQSGERSMSIGRPWPTGKTEHHFELEKTTTLDTLKHLPKVPFAHVIDLNGVDLQR